MAQPVTHYNSPRTLTTFTIIFIILSPLRPQKSPSSIMDVVFLIMDAFLVGQGQLAAEI